MPFTAGQLATGANYSLETFQRNDPVDQVNSTHETLKWLMAHKEMTLFGNGAYNAAVYISNNANYQNYFGADQVTYNERDPARQAKYRYYNYHDGFWFDEDRLAANGIILTDDREAVASGAEKIQLVNLLKVSYSALKNGINAALGLELLQNGSASAKSVPGLDQLVSTTPTTGVVGGIDASTATYWRNNADMGIVTTTAGTLTAEMETMWRACMIYGGEAPDYIVVGQAFYAAYVKDAGVTINRQIEDGGNLRGGVTLDGAINGAFFHGIPLVRDPDFERLDAALGAITYPWTKRAYFLNSRHITFRPMTGQWMINRKPERLPDRYVHYFGQTGKYGMSTDKRNSMAVLSVA